jgi:hypothetical protein
MQRSFEIDGKIMEKLKIDDELTGIAKSLRAQLSLESCYFSEFLRPRLSPISVSEVRIIFEIFFEADLNDNFELNAFILLGYNAFGAES